MLGFAPIGRLAIGQISSIIPISAKLQMSARARVAPSVGMSARLTARSGARGAFQVGVTGRLFSRLTSRANPGLPIAGRVSMSARLSARLAVGITGQTSMRLGIRGGEIRLPGSGKSYTAMPWLPQPDYEAKRKPFRPIWDIRRRQELEEERKRNEPKPAPLPPGDIFSSPAKITVQLDRLPDFSSLVLGEWRDVEAATREAQDATDAEFVLTAVVDADVSDITDAISAIQRTADQLMTLAMQQAAQAPQQKKIEIGIPPRTGGNGYDEQMQDVSDHADALSALRGAGIIPEEV